MLITNDELKQYLQLWDIDDCDVSIFARGASDFVVNYVGRSIESKSNTDLYNWHSEMDIVLENYPIISVTSASYNTGSYKNPIRELFDEDKRHIDTKSGILSFDFRLPRGHQNIKVIYQSWYTVIPSDLKLATLAIAGMLYNQRASNGITEETVGGDKLVYTKDIPSNISDILNLYANV